MIEKILNFIKGKILIPIMKIKLITTEEKEALVQRKIEIIEIMNIKENKSLMKVIHH